MHIKRYHLCGSKVDHPSRIQEDGESIIKIRQDRMLPLCSTTQRTNEHRQQFRFFLTAKNHLSNIWIDVNSSWEITFQLFFNTKTSIPVNLYPMNENIYNNSLTSSVFCKNIIKLLFWLTDCNVTLWICDRPVCDICLQTSVSVSYNSHAGWSALTVTVKKA